MATKIQTVHDGTTAHAVTGPLTVPSVATKTLPDVTASGKVASTAGIPVTCTITRHFRAQTEEGMAWTRTLFGLADKDPAGGKWKVHIGGLSPGTYLLSSSGLGETIDAVYINVPDKARLQTEVAITSTIANANSITVAGTTVNAGALVTCTLTPIDGNGNLRAGERSSTKTVTSMQNKVWSVAYVPGDVNEQRFSGLYTFEASAPNEGTVSEPINV
jgi:hypothetical protein